MSVEAEKAQLISTIAMLKREIARKEQAPERYAKCLGKDRFWLRVYEARLEKINEIDSPSPG
jgi:hypothetical protein